MTTDKPPLAKTASANLTTGEKVFIAVIIILGAVFILIPVFYLFNLVQTDLETKERISMPAWIGLGVLACFILYVVTGISRLRARNRKEALAGDPSLPPPPEVGNIVLEETRVNSASGSFLVWFLCMSLVGVPIVLLSASPNSGKFIFLLFFALPVVFSLYAMMGKTNPKVTLTLHNSPISTGDTVQISWSISGGLRKFNTVDLIVTGKEKVKYTVGTDIEREEHAFFKKALHLNEAELHQKRGMMTFKIPPENMHTWKSYRNEIEWKLHVLGKVSLTPNTDKHYPLIVYPNNKNRI